MLQWVNSTLQHIENTHYTIWLCFTLFEACLLIECASSQSNLIKSLPPCLSLEYCLQVTDDWCGVVSVVIKRGYNLDLKPSTGNGKIWQFSYMVFISTANLYTCLWKIIQLITAGRSSYRGKITLVKMTDQYSHWIHKYASMTIVIHRFCWVWDKLLNNLS